MTARSHYEVDAGQWVAFFVQKGGSFDGSPMYLWSTAGAGSTTARDCVRFDTKGEAIDTARRLWPHRTVSAVRVPPTCLKCGTSTTWQDEAWVCPNVACGAVPARDGRRFRRP